ncbi:MAG: hypothetical protein M3Q79_01475 [bacterium]|nr:hypothetical protein [bacterium]
MSVHTRSLEVLGMVVDPKRGVNGIADNTSLILCGREFALRTISRTPSYEYAGLSFDLSHEPLGLIAVRAELSEDMDYVRLVQDTVENVVGTNKLGKPHEVAFRGLTTSQQATARLFT